MILGIVPVMKVDVVTEKLAAHPIVAEFVMHERLRK
jgi:hypothetical protein